MTNTKTRDQTALLLKASYKLIHFCSHEEQRACKELQEIAAGADGGKARECFFWKMTSGFLDADGKRANGAEKTDSPVKALQWVIEREQKDCPPALYVMIDFHPYLSRRGEAVVIRKLKDTVQLLEQRYSAVMLLSLSLIHI